jgi:hypothetical protein
MSRKNGGIIGPANTPVGGLITGLAGGVWRMNDVANFVGNSQWPLAPQSIDNSLRFDDGSSDSLTKTLSSSNRKIYTISTWVKRSELGSVQNIFTSGANGVGDSGLRFLSGNNISFYEILSPYSSYDFSLETNAVFRDVSAWYHIVISVDTTQATDSNRIKIYVNNSQITSFSSASYPSQDFQGFINHDFSHQVSGAVDTNFGNRYFNGYQAEFVFIDGQQLDPTSFGEFDTTTGIWKPKKIGSFTSAGTNSFYLDFKDSSNVGKDASGLSNNFTVNNLTSIDQSTDTCVENYATLNPLVAQSTGTFSEGNCKNASSSSTNFGAVSTMGVSSGKWYAEFKPVSATGNKKRLIGACGNISGNGTAFDTIYMYGLNTTGDSGSETVNTIVNTTETDVTSSYTGYFENDIVGVALDMDNNKIYFSVNGTFENSSNPVTGTGGLSLGTSPPDGVFYFAVMDVRNADVITYEANFGNPPFSISSGNSDANGFGNFEYSVPSGYYALNTSNLNTYG